MFNNHPAAEALADLYRQKPAVAKQKPVFDACDTKDEKQGTADVLDAVDEASDAAGYASADIALKAVAALQEWAETTGDDLDEGESYATRLYALIGGIADADGDGEIGEAEADVMESALETAWDYLSAKGVSDDDISAVLNDWDDSAADRVQEVLASSLPDGDEAAAQDMDDFVFGDGSDEAALDAVYKKRIVIKKGKKVRVNKRVSGFVKKTAKQKVAIRKMLKKSHSAVAQARRMKSMKIRKKMGM